MSNSPQPQPLASDTQSSESSLGASNSSDNTATVVTAEVGSDDCNSAPRERARQSTIAISVSNMAGFSQQLVVRTARTTVLSVKYMIAATNPAYAVERQRLLHADASDEPLADHALLSACGVKDGTELVILLADLPGKWLRSINGYSETESSLATTLFDNDSRCCMVEDAKDGRLVFVERHRHHVICIDCKTHALLWKFGRTGRQGRDNAHLSSPSACAPSPDGAHLYICDSENARVVVLCAQSGKFVSTFPASPNYFASAGWTLSMAVSATDGHVWICNPDGRGARMLASVTSFDAAGVVVCQLKFPPRTVYPAKHCSIALGRNLVFFADRCEHCVLAFSAATGDLVQTIGKGPSVAKGKLFHPTCVCVSGTVLYVGEAENKRVSVFNATTFEFLGLMDAPPGSDGFPSVHHISASTLTHEIFVNDLRLKQVHVFSAYQC